MVNYSIILGNLGNTCDRFLSSGYKDDISKDILLKQASEIDGVKGVELVSTWDVTSETVDEIGELLGKYNLECVECGKRFEHNKPTTLRCSTDCKKQYRYRYMKQWRQSNIEKLLHMTCSVYFRRFI